MNENINNRKDNFKLFNQQKNKIRNTWDYINLLKGENVELTQRIDSLESSINQLSKRSNKTLSSNLGGAKLLDTRTYSVTPADFVYGYSTYYYNTWSPYNLESQSDYYYANVYPEINYGVFDVNKHLYYMRFQYQSEYPACWAYLSPGWGPHAGWSSRNSFFSISMIYENSNIIAPSYIIDTNYLQFFSSDIGAGWLYIPPFYQKCTLQLWEI